MDQHTTSTGEAPVIRETDILDLIRRADGHELGRDFLLNGSLGSVAAMFGVHAFLVDAVRDKLEADPTFA